jgi:hypothetical protein
MQSKHDLIFRIYWNHHTDTKRVRTSLTSFALRAGTDAHLSIIPCFLALF